MKGLSYFVDCELLQIHLRYRVHTHLAFQEGRPQPAAETESQPAATGGDDRRQRDPIQVPDVQPGEEDLPPGWTLIDESGERDDDQPAAKVPRTASSTATSSSDAPAPAAATSSSAAAVPKSKPKLAGLPRTAKPKAKGAKGGAANLFAMLSK